MVHVVELADGAHAGSRQLSVSDEAGGVDGLRRERGSEELRRLPNFDCPYTPDRAGHGPIAREISVRGLCESGAEMTGTSKTATKLPPSAAHSI